MFGLSQSKLAPHWMALSVTIYRCSPKLRLQSNCTPRYLILFIHTAFCSQRTIFGYWKDLLSVTSIFSGTIFRRLLSNQRFACHRFSLILSPRILTPSAAHTITALSVQPIILIPLGRSMRRKSSHMTFHTSGPARDHMSSFFWGTIYLLRISSTCCSDSHLSSATGSLEPSSASSPRSNTCISRYWTHCVFQCCSTCRIPYAYRFLFLLQWRCLLLSGWRPQWTCFSKSWIVSSKECSHQPCDSVVAFLQTCKAQWNGIPKRWPKVQKKMSDSINFQ